MMGRRPRLAATAAGGRRRGIETQRFEEKAEEVDLEEVKAARERAAAALRAAHERAAARE